MSFAFYAFAMLVVANPFRWRLSLPEDDGRVRPRPLVVGVALLAVVAVAFGLWAGDALDWLDISPESWRIAAGIIAIGAGLWVMARPQRREEPSLSGDLPAWSQCFSPCCSPPSSTCC